jgi:type I restriction enzyme S subunit
MNNQIEISFGEIGRTITGKTPSSDDPEDFGEGYPFVTPTDSLDSKYVLHTARQLSDEGLRKLKSKALPPDSVLVSCIGSAMGKVVMNSTTCITNQQLNSIVVDTGRFCPHYVYYALRNSYKLLRNAASGSTPLPMLNKTDFEKLKIRVFKDKAHQRKIAAVLSALDAKIALNHRINSELEEMAKMLYDYWFAQYDFPLSAAQAAALGKPRLAGKPYRSSGGPMVHHPQLKREIPKGWSAGSLNCLGEIVGGSTPSTKEDHFFSSQGTPWITPKDHSRNAGNKFITRGETGVSDAGIKGASLTLLPAGTVLMSSRAPIGYIAIARNPVTTNQGFKSFVPSKGYSTEFIYYTLNHQMKTIEQNASGSTFKEVSGGTLKAIQTQLPEPSVLFEFSELMKPIFSQQNTLERQNQELTALRDWLLPMLMNGQVRVG